MEKYPSGRRGSPAKGVGLLKGARVQIPASPLIEKPVIAMITGLFFVLIMGFDHLFDA